MPGPWFCPWCGASLAAATRSCPGCREDLSGVLGAEISLAVEAATREDAAAGRFFPGTDGVFRRFRVSTVGVGILLASGLGLVAVLRGSDSASPVLPTLGWAASLLCPIPFLVLLIQDLLLRSPENLTTPRAAYETWIKCLREKRWAYAHGLVVPRGREGERRRPAGVSFAVDSPKGFAAYWRRLLHSGALTVRTFGLGSIHVEETGPDTAVAGCVLRVTTYPAWVSLLLLCYVVPAVVAWLVLRKTEEVALDVALLRVDGRWYLLDAAPIPPADRGPP
jgi:hypothetical protein